MESNDGIGIVNSDIMRMFYKRADGMIVTVESRENIDGEIRYSFLKGIIKPIDLFKVDKGGKFLWRSLVKIVYGLIVKIMGNQFSHVMNGLMILWKSKLKGEWLWKHWMIWLKNY